MPDNQLLGRIFRFAEMLHFVEALPLSEAKDDIA